MPSSQNTRLTDIVLGALSTAVAIGSYTAWVQGDQRVTGNLDVAGILSGSSLQVDGTSTFSTITPTTVTGATTVYLLSGSLIMPDADGVGCSLLQFNDGTPTGDSVACP